jgi:tetratricopeptide (TPR) repeat protein
MISSPSPIPVSSPTAVAVPERPAEFERYAPVIAGYLNDTDGDQDALRAMLNDWGALRHATDLLRIDVDEDGVGELLLVIINPSPEYGIDAEGDLLVLDFQNKGYQVGYSAAGGSVLPDPALLEVDDLNEDGYTEIAYSSTSCGAHTCFTKVYIVSSGRGTYADLTAGGIEMAYVEPYFTDWDNDGVPELIMHGGTIGSVGAGPQRERTEVYRWDGAKYVLTETVLDYSNYLYFRVLDANQALLAGDYERAATLYREAIDSPYLDVWMDEGERDDLAAFSRYRLTLTFLIMGEAGQAEAAREELEAAQPENIYTQVATVLWDAYQREGEHEAACQEVNDFAQLHPEVVQVLADYGYSNPTFTPAEVCPLELF